MANFPQSVDEIDNLLTIADNAKNFLASAISAGDNTPTITVVDGTSFPDTKMSMTINGEIFIVVKAGPNQFTTTERAMYGTAQLNHPIGSVCYGSIISAHHNELRNAIIKTQTYSANWFRKPIESALLITAPTVGLVVDACYIVAGTGGDWSTATIGDIAYIEQLGSPVVWKFITPSIGMTCLNKDTNALVTFGGATWDVPDIDTINGVALSGLATGLLKNTTGTGVPSIATPGTDYVVGSDALNHVLSLNSGVLTGGTVTINADPTKFDVAAGTGMIVNWTTPATPVCTYVTWTAKTAQTIPDFTKGHTRIFIDVSGNLVKDSGGLDTPQSRRNYIVLPLLSHPNLTTITNVSPNRKPAYENVEALTDFIKALGPINTGNGITANGANLFVNKSAGVFTAPWVNQTIDGQDPCNIIMTAATAASFTTAYRNGSGGTTFGASTTSIPVTQYDDGTGTLHTLSNNNWVIHRMYVFANNLLSLCYGQAEYANLSDANAAIYTENFTPPPSFTQGRAVTAIIVKKSATALNNTAQAIFVNLQTIGGSGGVVVIPSLQAAFNASPLEPNPDIITTATNPHFILQGGSGSDTDNLLQGNNNVGTETFAFTAAGRGTCLDLTITGTGGLGLLNLPSQSSNPATPASGVNIFAGSTGKFSWKGTSGYVRTFDGTLTADRSYVLPDRPGIVALDNESTTTVSSSSGVVTIDLALVHKRYELTLTENVTSWVFSNVPASGSFKEIFITIIQHASAAKTVVSPATSGRTAGGIAWVASTTLSAREALVIHCMSDSTRTLFPTGVQV